MLRRTILLNEDLVKQVVLLSKKENGDFSSSLRYTLRIGILAISAENLC
jgi:hypothetical protein